MNSDSFNLLSSRRSEKDKVQRVQQQPSYRGGEMAHYTTADNSRSVNPSRGAQMRSAPVRDRRSPSPSWEKERVPRTRDTRENERGVHLRDRVISSLKNKYFL